MNKGLLDRYNHRDNLIIISEYAYYDKGTTGLARFSKNTSEAIIKRLKNPSSSSKVIILANIVNNEEIYEECDALIIRCFKKNEIWSFCRIFWYLRLLSHVKKVLFEFEFATYGGLKIVLTIPFLLVTLFLLKKKIYFILHQVVTDLSTLSTHLGMSRNSLKLKMLEKGLHLFYILLGLLSYKVIVLEQEFKDRLERFIPNKKIEVIPHGIEQFTPIKSSLFYRKQIGLANSDFVVMVFGYVTWYKGIDRLIKIISELPGRISGKRVKLIIAGGESYAQKGTLHYYRYFQKVNKLLTDNHRVIFTGFVPEKDIEKYYQAADLCILPYREFISSSGPFSLAVSYLKPVLLSKELVSYRKSKDFQGCLLNSGLSDNDLFINLSSLALADIIKRIIKSRRYKKNMNNFLRYLLIKRSWDTLAEKYCALLFQIKNNYRYQLLFDYNY